VLWQTRKMESEYLYRNKNVVDSCLCGHRRKHIPDNIWKVVNDSDDITSAYYYRCPACSSYSAVNLHFEPDSYSARPSDVYCIPLEKRHLNRARVCWIREHFEYFPESPTIYDLGSGEGAFTEALKVGFPGAAITSVEADTRMYEKFQAEYEGVTRAPEYIEPFLSRHASSAELIVLTDVMEHVIDPRALLRLIMAALKPGMVAYLTTPNGASYHEARSVKSDDINWHDANVTRQHLWMLSPAFMMKLIAETGEILDYSRTFETNIRRDSDYSTFLVRRPLQL
jgi:2-polyprenyl-3-methyl-5-hydroxy-6-metoxy-1,4-benzoquinol methylase